MVARLTLQSGLHRQCPVTADAARTQVPMSYSDVWVSMGEEAVLETRMPLRHLKVTPALMASRQGKTIYFIACPP